MHGQPPRTIDEGERRRIAAAYRSGVPLAGLQKRFRLSADTLKRVLSEAGIEIEQRRREKWGIEHA